MRKALNENPRVQLAVLGVGALVLVFLLMTSLGGGSSTEPEATDPLTTEQSATGTPASTAPATPATPAPATPAPSGLVTPTAPAPTTSTVPPDGESAEGLLPSAGLPEDVLVAYARNKAIALLVIDPKAISDTAVEKYTEALRSEGDVEVFVVKAGKIADYARITQGVAVSRTPSLVVIRPRDKSSDVPVASVSEGFRDAKSVKIALEDALYTDGPVPSYPE